MKKIMILIAAPLLFGCPTKGMQQEIDSLSSQVSKLSLENKEVKSYNEKLSKENEKHEYHLEMLCALYGESQGRGYSYVGDYMWMNSAGELTKMDEMMDLCLEMADVYGESVKNRALSLGGQEEE